MRKDEMSRAGKGADEMSRAQRQRQWLAGRQGERRDETKRDETRGDERREIRRVG